MIDYIKIKKIWQDDEILKLKVESSSEHFTVTSYIYASDELIDELSFQIKQFLDGKVNESSWANEDKGDASTACVSFHFIHKDIKSSGPKYICTSAGLGKKVLSGGEYWRQFNSLMYVVSGQLYVVDGGYWEIFE